MSEVDVGAPTGSSPMARWWDRLSRGQRVAVTVVGAVIALNVTLVGLRSAIGSDPGGPASSSLSTGAGGLEAMADLARSAGHPVVRQRDTPEVGSLPVDAVVVVADPRGMTRDDFLALVQHPLDGGHLVVAGEAATPILQAVAAPSAGHESVEPSTSLAVDDPSGQFSVLRDLAGDGGGRWARVDDLTVHVADAEGRPVLVSGPAGSGTVTALADANLLHNRTLGQADNAALALLLLGADGDEVVFVESVHGFATSGLDALPPAWKWAGAGAVLAFVLGLWWAASRLGPPEPAERALRPPRLDHVRAVAADLDRVSTHPSDLVEPLVRANRAHLADRLGVTEDASDAVWDTAVRDAGLHLESIAVARRQPHDLDAALAVGAAAAARQRATLGLDPVPGSPVAATVPDPDAP